MPDDVLGQVCERFALTRRPNPQGEPRDLDRLFRQVRAVEVVGEDDVGDGFLQGRGGRSLLGAEAVGDVAVPLFKDVIGLNEEGAAAAGGVAHLDVTKRLPAVLPVGGQGERGGVGFHLLLIQAARDAQALQALVDDGRNGVPHDEAREVGRRVVDAEALPFRRLRHEGGAAFPIALAVRAKQGRPQVLQLPDRLLENVPEDVNVHLVAEVVLGDGVEKVGPAVFELQIIHLLVFLEQAAVVSCGEGEAFVALVDGLEKAEEILPPGVRHFAERRHGLVRRLDALLRQEAPLFAESDEDDSVQQLLRDVDGGLRRLAVPAAKVVDQAESIVAVGLVEFVAYFAPPALRQLQQGQCTGRLVGLGSQQAADLEQAIELPEQLFFSEVLKMKFLVGERRLVAVVEAERHEVADNPPGTTGKGVQVVPALLNGRPAVETVTVKVGVCTL